MAVMKLVKRRRDDYDRPGVLHVIMRLNITSQAARSGRSWSRRSSRSSSGLFSNGNSAQGIGRSFERNPTSKMRYVSALYTLHF